MFTNYHRHRLYSQAFVVSIMNATKSAKDIMLIILVENMFIVFMLYVE